MDRKSEPAAFISAIVADVQDGGVTNPPGVTSVPQIAVQSPAGKNIPPLTTTKLQALATIKRDSAMQKLGLLVTMQPG